MTTCEMCTAPLMYEHIQAAADRAENMAVEHDRLARIFTGPVSAAHRVAATQCRELAAFLREAPLGD